jgi:S-adenosylmethionine/arginine decarboxylase-like enzyme
MTEEDFNKDELWGMSLSLDLYNCNPDTIRDADKIKEYVKELCDNVINMKRYGECQVVHFGDDPKVTGFSMTQLIETSLVSGHFANNTNAAYLDIFSCKWYDVHKVKRFSKRFFEAEVYISNVSERQ